MRVSKLGNLVVAAVVGLPLTLVVACSDDPTPAPAPPVRPKAAGRLVKMIDFEEHADRKRPDFDPDAVPQAWVNS